MTRHGLGLAKTEVIRIHKEDKIDLMFLKRRLNMSESYNEGDVIHQIIKQYKIDTVKGKSPFFVEGQKGQNSEIRQSEGTLDEYIYLYEEALNNSKTWKGAAEHLAAKHNENVSEIVHMINHPGR